MPYLQSRPLAFALVCGLSAPLIAAPLENVLTYQGRLDVFGHPSIEDLTYYNVIAQEFAEVFPEAVKPSGQYLPGQPQTPENAVLQVDFHPASVLTIAAVQELALRLEQENAALREELAALRAAVEALTP